MHDIGNSILAEHNDPLNKGGKEESKAVNDADLEIILACLGT